VQQATAALIEKNGKILLALRKAGKHMGARWELPGGKINSGETPVQALSRELAEEFAVGTEIGDFLGETRYRDDQVDLQILLYRVVPLSEDFTLREHVEVRWVNPQEVESFDLVDSDRLLLRRYLHRLT
jgi:8-oxo-dGTP diphosphatase